MQESVVHAAIGHQAFGVDLQRGQHHVGAVIPQHHSKIRGVLVHLQVQQETAATSDRQIFRPRLCVTAGLQRSRPDALVKVGFSVRDHLRHNIFDNSVPDCMLRTR